MNLIPEMSESKLPYNGDLYELLKNEVQERSSLLFKDIDIDSLDYKQIYDLMKNKFQEFEKAFYNAKVEKFLTSSIDLACISLLVLNWAQLFANEYEDLHHICWQKESGE